MTEQIAVDEIDLPVLQTQRLYKKIADILEHQIRTKVLQEGSYLPSERDLAKKMGVSRTSVREALIALEVKGLVTVKVGDGVQICHFSQHALNEDSQERSVIEQLQARALIEGELAALAAKHATSDQIQCLTDNLKQMQACYPASDTFLQLDHEFHQMIAEAANHQVLMDQQKSLWALRYQPIFKKFEEHYTSDPKEQSAVLSDHSAILQAITQHNSRQARLAIQQHLKRVQKVFVR